MEYAYIGPKTTPTDWHIYGSPMESMGIYNEGTHSIIFEGDGMPGHSVHNPWYFKTGIASTPDVRPLQFGPRVAFGCFF